MRIREGIIGGIKHVKSLSDMKRNCYRSNSGSIVCNEEEEKDVSLRGLCREVKKLKG